VHHEGSFDLGRACLIIFVDGFFVMSVVAVPGHVGVSGFGSLFCVYRYVSYSWTFQSNAIWIREWLNTVRPDMTTCPRVLVCRVVFKLVFIVERSSEQLACRMVFWKNGQTKM
jgi:hypothetical protein